MWLLLHTANSGNCLYLRQPCTLSASVLHYGASNPKQQQRIYTSRQQYRFSAANFRTAFFLDAYYDTGLSIPLKATRTLPSYTFSHAERCHHDYLSATE
jgi:hypothetical protein